MKLEKSKWVDIFKHNFYNNKKKRFPQKMALRGRAIVVIMNHL